MTEQKTSNKIQLYLKFMGVQGKLEPLEKSGKNEFHKYAYTTASDVLDPVRRICNNFELILFASVVESRVERGQAWVTVELTCVDPETGASISTRATGYAEEWSSKDNKPTGDKAIYKAQTGAIKYAVRLMFCLPSEDDPEKDPPSSRSSATSTTSTASTAPPRNDLISEAQRKRLYALIKENNINNTHAKAIILKWGYYSSSDIKKQDYEAICDAITKFVPVNESSSTDEIPY